MKNSLARIAAATATVLFLFGCSSPESNNLDKLTDLKSEIEGLSLKPCFSDLEDIDEKVNNASHYYNDEISKLAEENPEFSKKHQKLLEEIAMLQMKKGRQANYNC